MELRKQGITQRELAKKTGMKYQQINKLLKGATNITLKTLRKIELALGLKFIQMPEKYQFISEKYDAESAPFPAKQVAEPAIEYGK